ncbi:MAG: hypothetical protein COY80_02050 [Candidatus Pacebacteria bacterium CG_4_10_14_0_8_um_filter_42_14]|nr:MAG: hypothetical protein COY80_02050 [Candidatus Pacebacteria bacterium CG_4_10_14_0_8_um_filter_42_14]
MSLHIPDFRLIFSKDIGERNAGAYYFSQLFHSLIFLAPIWVPYYIARITAAEMSILFVAMYLSQMFFELPSGALADMIGRRQTILWGFVVGGISYVIYPLFPTFWWFLFLAICMGAADAFRSGSEEALLYDTYIQVGDEERFAGVYADGNIIYQVGLVISAVIGGLLFGINEQAPFVLYGVSLFVGAIVTLRYIEPKIDSVKFSISSYFSQIKLGTEEAFKSEYAKYVSLFYIFVGGIAWSSTLYFDDVLMAALVPADALRGFIFAGMRFLNISVVMLVLKHTKLFNWNRTILFFPVIMLLGYLPGAWLYGLFGTPFVFLAMVATTARWVILAPITNKVFSSKYRATAISALSLLIGVVYVILTGASSFLVPLLGIRVMFSLLGVISLVTVVPVGVKLLRVSGR